MKICLVGKSKHHTEIAGFFMYALQNHDISVCHPWKDSPSNCLPYYQNILSKPLNYVEKVEEDKYDMIIFMTSREVKNYRFSFKDMQKVFIVAHRPEDVYKRYHNISLTPLIPAKTIFLPIYRFANTHTRENFICLVGNLKFRCKEDLDYLMNMIENSNYKLFIFCRANDSIHALVEGFNNTHFIQDLSTDDMLNYIRRSKFLLTLERKDSRYRKSQLTGVIPLSLNNLVPMITSEAINHIYQLEGNICYKDSVSEVLYDALMLDRDSYIEKVQQIVKTRDRIIDLNDRHMKNITNKLETSRETPMIAYMRETKAKKIEMPRYVLVSGNGRERNIYKKQRYDTEKTVSEQKRDEPVKTKMRTGGKPISRGKKLLPKNKIEKTADDVIKGNNSSNDELLLKNADYKRERSWNKTKYIEFVRRRKVRTQNPSRLDRNSSETVKVIDAVNDAVNDVLSRKIVDKRETITSSPANEDESIMLKPDHLSSSNVNSPSDCDLESDSENTKKTRQKLERHIPAKRRNTRKYVASKVEIIEIEISDDEDKPKKIPKPIFNRNRRMPEPSVDVPRKEETNISPLSLDDLSSKNSQIAPKIVTDIFNDVTYKKKKSMSTSRCSYGSREKFTW